MRTLDAVMIEGRHDGGPEDEVDVGTGFRRFWALCAVAAVTVAAFAIWVQFEIGGTTVTTWVNDLTEVAAAVAAWSVRLGRPSARRHPAGVDLARRRVGRVGRRPGRVVVVRAGRG